MAFACAEGPDRDIEQDLYVNYLSLSLFVGDEVTVTASPTTGTTFGWESENTSVATVSGGAVRAIGEGETNIIVTGNGVTRTIPVVVTVKIPVTGISVSKTALDMKPGENVVLTTKLLPTNTNVKSTIVWKSSNPSIARVIEGSIDALSVGSCVITASLAENPSIKTDVAIVVDYTFPFNGPHVISKAAVCTIQARDFDYGGQGFAYYDTSTSRGTPDYRPDIPAGSNIPMVEGGTHIGYVGSGEWLLFTVEVTDEADYRVDWDITAAGDNGTIQLKVDGDAAFSPFVVPNNGSWGSFAWISERYPGTTLPTVHLTAGKHKLTVLFVAATYNFRGIRFSYP
ncbi:MAG: Ig-like domain-containing protein [Dysgonamonadaceae bacterium]|nr:Ig-like domain-containing protein [Dysgonamonadaceae bacterium]